MDNRVRVVIATGIMNAGGAETLIMELLRWKSPFVHYILLVHHEGNPQTGVYDEEILQTGTPIVYIPSVGSSGYKKYKKRFLEIIEQIGPVDVIHSHLNAVGGLIAKVAKQAGIRCRIVHCHADIVFKGNKFKVLLQEIKLAMMKLYVNQYANYFWACSDEAARRVFFRAKQSLIIPNVINMKKYFMTYERVVDAKRKFHMENQFVIGAVGRIARIKNYEFIIKLLAQMKDQGEALQFVCFGRVVDEVYFNELMHMAREMGVIEQVHFYGNSTAVWDDIGCIDTFLMPSHTEGFGIAALEAQAAGLPTIVSTGVPALIDIGAQLVQFISLEDEDKWIRAILNSRRGYRIDNQTILQCFNRKGYNSEVTVKKIEEKYRIMKMENK